MVLPAQSGHHHGQELLPGGLLLRGEGGSHFGGDDNGQAVSQQLYKGGTTLHAFIFYAVIIFVYVHS